MGRLSNLCALLLVLGLITGFSSPAAEQPDQADVPAELRTPAGFQRSLLSVGHGTQVYDCTDGAWKLREPRAAIADAQTHDVVAIHFLGPTWQSTQDGSGVVAAVQSRKDAPDAQHDIPWLLLKATGNTGPGVFSEVQYIQRLATKGGVAPAGACSAGETASVAYEATYAFWSPAQ